MYLLIINKLTFKLAFFAIKINSKQKVLIGMEPEVKCVCGGGGIDDGMEFPVVWWLRTRIFL